MLEEMALARERLAVLSNDLDSLDRTLEGLGYAGDVDLPPLKWSSLKYDFWMEDKVDGEEA